MSQAAAAAAAAVGKSPKDVFCNLPNNS